MRNGLLAALAVLFAGCAITAEQANNMSEFELCDAAWAPLAPNDRKASAIQHLRERGEDCSRYAGILQSKYNAAAGMVGAGVGMVGVQQQVRANEISQYNANRQRTCSYQRVGSTIQQVCN